MSISSRKLEYNSSRPWWHSLCRLVLIKMTVRGQWGTYRHTEQHKDEIQYNSQRTSTQTAVVMPLPIHYSYKSKTLKLSTKTMFSTLDKNSTCCCWWCTQSCFLTDMKGWNNRINLFSFLLTFADNDHIRSDILFFRPKKWGWNKNWERGKCRWSWCYSHPFSGQKICFLPEKKMHLLSVYFTNIRFLLFRHPVPDLTQGWLGKKTIVTSFS